MMPQSSYSLSPRCFEDFLSFFRFFVAMASLPSAPEGSSNRPSGVRAHNVSFSILQHVPHPQAVHCYTIIYLPMRNLRSLPSPLFFLSSPLLLCTHFLALLGLSSQSEVS